MANSNYRWVIVAAGGVLGCVAIGGMFSLPVFLQPIARDTGWSVTGVSSAMTIGFLAMAFTSMIWGTLSDRIGPLPEYGDSALNCPQACCRDTLSSIAQKNFPGSTILVSVPARRAQ
jgi:MFS family permease